MAARREIRWPGRWATCSAGLCMAALGGSALACTSGENCEGVDCGVGGGEQGIPCPESGVLHGPWALRFDETSAVVRWDACRPSPSGLSLAPETGGAALAFEGTQTATVVLTSHHVIDAVPPDLPGTYYLTEVSATGLQPATCYGYTLEADPEREGRFCTARPSGASFDFVAIGDTNPAVGDTAGVLEHGLDPPPDFSLHVGDIQYYASVFETWATWFPAMQPLLSAGSFMPTIGNHEYEIDHEFEDYYVRLFGGAGDGTIDYYRYHSGGVWLFTVNTESDFGPGTEQGDWLEASVAEAAAQPGYRMGIVYFHRPMITLADYAQQSSERAYFAPLFQQYGVKLVFQGHVHGYERFYDPTYDLTYVTTGGGGAALHDLDARIADRPVEAAMREASAAVYQSVQLSVGATSLEARAVSHLGDIIDTFSIALP